MEPASAEIPSPSSSSPQGFHSKLLRPTKVSNTPSSKYYANPHFPRWPEPGIAPPRLLASAWLEQEMTICYTIGCHPHFAPSLLKAGALQLLERLLLEGKGRGCVAVGECGMDRSSGCRVSVKVQAQAFRLQVKLAMKLNLPLVLHIRDAEEVGLSILKEVGLPANWPIHR